MKRSLFFILFCMTTLGMAFTALRNDHTLKSQLTHWYTAQYEKYVHPDRKTHGFGKYNHGLSFNGDSRHYGIDYALPENTKILAPTHGTVTRTFKNKLGGNVLEIREANGTHYQWFMHLNRYKVKVGDTVSPGEVIAQSGNTGEQTTGPHLHFQRMKGGIGNRFAEDPEPFINQLPHQQRSLYRIE